MAIRIELLSATHARSSFDCGEEALNEFLRRFAGQQQRRGLGKTYVAVDVRSAEVAGFVTLSVGQVAARVMPPQLKLPRYPVPVLRMGRLGVDKRSQGLGIGQDLLAFALRLAVEFSEKVGLYAVVVDAKDERVAAFYRKLGFEATLDDPLCLFIPVSKLGQAST